MGTSFKISYPCQFDFVKGIHNQLIECFFLSKFQMIKLVNERNSQETRAPYRCRKIIFINRIKM